MRARWRLGDADGDGEGCRSDCFAPDACAAPRAPFPNTRVAGIVSLLSAARGAKSGEGAARFCARGGAAATVVSSGPPLFARLPLGRGASARAVASTAASLFVATG